ncbi:MAG: hypothetical protein FH753_06650 [Firmicutes bacterium]|nr:hypothetical protein [Bacillota bacterium]
MLKYILGVIFFAIATMIIYAWGFVKDQKTPNDLIVKLNNKAEKKIIKYLKEKGTLSKKEVSKLLSGMTVSKFGTKKKIVVNEPKKLAKSVIDNMLKKDIIEVDYEDRKNKYILKS